MTKTRLLAAAAVAFVLGVPMTEKASAQDATGIVGAAISLAIAIVDVAGSS